MSDLSLLSANIHLPALLGLLSVFAADGLAGFAGGAGCGEAVSV